MTTPSRKGLTIVSPFLILACKPITGSATYDFTHF